MAAAVLDLFYYRLLLEGAVKAIIDLERKYPDIQISTEIERAVGPGKWVIFPVYGLLLIALGIFAVRSWMKSRKD